ncbi:MAG: glycosyltransferase [Proteobacteria bacterium]|nr:glycosyltransferase [Pseudomonadota bacterium]NIS72123.1 glycosyltransferase [Pseudomonadota bacterium]
MPQVSVVMSVYNEERYVGEAVESILEQTFGDFEFIIVDDGSIDHTPVVLKGYHDSRMKVYYQENRGQSSALNRGIRLTSGDYIARMDADDISLPERLEREVLFLDTYPEVALVGTWCVKIDARTGRHWIQSLPEDDVSIRRFMTVDNPFIHSSIMIRKSVLDEVGLYDEGLIWQDYDLWVRIARNHRMANISEPLVIRRKHPASLTWRARKSREFWELFIIQCKAAKQLGLRGEGLTAMIKSLAKAVGYKIHEPQSRQESPESLSRPSSLL